MMMYKRTKQTWYVECVLLSLIIMRMLCTLFVESDCDWSNSNETWDQQVEEEEAYRKKCENAKSAQDSSLKMSAKQVHF